VGNFRDKTRCQKKSETWRVLAQQEKIMTSANHDRTGIARFERGLIQIHSYDINIVIVPPD